MAFYQYSETTDQLNPNSMFPKKSVILVTGANGQLGKEFRWLASQQDEFEFLFTSRDTLDVTIPTEVMHIFNKFRPDVCINCAAYTAVDKAESDSENAFLVNSASVKNLVDACQLYQCKLINFSTDYVYDSIIDHAILETDRCEPKGVYGKSKRAGELVLENSTIKWINLRVSWLYSSFNHNFVKTMLRLGDEKDELNIVNDQIGVPTYARDLALDVLNIIKSTSFEESTGHYNYSHSGQTNWAEYAEEIFKLTKIQCNVNGISTALFGAPAPRPQWSVMSKDKIKTVFKIELRDWKSALKDCLELL